MPAESVGCVTPQVSAALPKCRSRASAIRYSSLSINGAHSAVARPKRGSSPYNRNFLSLDKEEGIVRLNPRPDGLWMVTLNVSNQPAAGKNGPSGGGRRRPRRTPKGRQVDLEALEEVRAPLRDPPR